MPYRLDGGPHDLLTHNNGRLEEGPVVGGVGAGVRIDKTAIPVNISHAQERNGKGEFYSAHAWWA
jgi:hypothetical protein